MPRLPLGKQDPVDRGGVTEPAAPAEEPASPTEQPGTEEGPATPTEAPVAATKTKSRTKAVPAEPELPVTPEVGFRLTDEDPYINLCFYGMEGTGKTTDAAYMANLGRVLFIEAESGLKGKRLREIGVDIDNIVVWPNRAAGEAITFEGMEDLFWKLLGDLKTDPNSWVGTVWDSLTEIHKLLLDNITAEALSRANAAGKARDRFFIDRGDYGVMTEQVRLLIRRFRDLQCHFVVCALERRDVDNDGQVRYGPSITPRLMEDIPGFFDVLVHTEVVEVGGEQVYAGLTRQGTKYRAKDRWNATPRFMVEPTFQRVALYKDGELDYDTDPKQVEMRQRQQRQQELSTVKA